MDPSDVQTNKFRRHHKKSRFGCKNCKARKIKCDEAKPSCTNCIIRQTPCDFQASVTASSSGPLPKVSIARQSSTDTGDRASRSSSETQINSIVPPSIGQRLFVDQTDSSRLLELRLWHHYLSRLGDLAWSECGSGAFAPHGRQLSLGMPKMALKSDYLMDAVLSMSGLSLYTLNPADQSTLTTSHRYMARGITRFRNALMADLNPSDVELLSATSMIVAVHTLSQHLLCSADSASSTNVFEWIHAFRGLRAIHMLTGRKSRFPFADGLGKHCPPDDVTDDCDTRLHPFAFLLKDSATTRLPVAEKAVYRPIVAYLASIYQSPNPTRDQMAWFLIQNRADFLECCDNERPKARLLLGAYLSFVVAINKNRPLGQIGAQDVMMIKKDLDADDAAALTVAGDLIAARFSDNESDGQIGVAQMAPPRDMLSGFSLFGQS